ncbi:class I SAM-dependent methyltransferase [Undibacterium sp. Tian12W]|uniref:class I SAM-dependent methyltransferase n=1 Tax=Undibacterium sp. Tian12W TaxID=3413054 RepID=UPI003BF04176
MSENKMREYYAQRAQTLEKVYQKPERQQDLREIQGKVLDVLKDQRVLEVACGTGYWTERFAPVAASVVATDYNQPMLDVAQAKAYPEGKVQFALADLHELPAATANQYTTCFAGFFWSHVMRDDQTSLLGHLSKVTGKGTTLVLIDNNYVEGSSTVIARTDLEGNTFQLRKQEDGSRVEILKNFPTDSALRKKFGPAVRDIRIFRNTYYWMLTCTLK